MEDIEEYVGIIKGLIDEFKKEKKDVPLELIPAMASTVFIQRSKGNNNNAPKVSAVYRLQKSVAEAHEGKQKEVNEFLFSKEYMDSQTVSKAITLAESR